MLSRRYGGVHFDLCCSRHVRTCAGTRLFMCIPADTCVATCLAAAHPSLLHTFRTLTKWEAGDGLAQSCYCAIPTDHAEHQEYGFWPGRRARIWQRARRLAACLNSCTPHGSPNLCNFEAASEPCTCMECKTCDTAAHAWWERVRTAARMESARAGDAPGRGRWPAQRS